MKTCYFLIGLPGSGKTTFANQTGLDRVSTNDVVEELSEKRNELFRDNFESKFLIAKRKAKNEKKRFVAEGKDFVWDQTNVFSTKIEGSLQYLKSRDYTVYAIFFNRPLNEVMSENEKRIVSGRDTPNKTLQEMIEQYKSLTPEKLASFGFDVVVEFYSEN